MSYITLPLAEQATEEEKASARKKANIIFQRLSQDSDFLETAKAEGLSAKETDFFSMDNPDLKEGWSLDLLTAIFKAPKGTVLPPADSMAGIQILKITDLRPSASLNFDAVKDTIKEKIAIEKATAQAKTEAEKIVVSLEERLGKGSTFEEAVLNLKLEAQKTPFLILGDYIPGIGISDDFQTAAMELNKDKRLSKVVMTPKGPAIIYWEAADPVDEKKFEEIKKDFAATLFEEQRIAALNKVIKDVKDKARLENYLDKKNNK